MTDSGNKSENLSNSDPKIIEPVQYLAEDEGRKPEAGTALCLSGGGYRAMLFHAGVLWRLNEMGLLPELKRISSVSGGSITAGVLAMNWGGLEFNAQNAAGNFAEQIVLPLRKLASRTIDATSVITGALWVGSIGDKIADAYRSHLFGEKTLQDIPDAPRFVFNATNVQSGALWRFMKPYMRDYRVGEIKNPRVELAVAIAASSAFPPVLSPVELELDPDDFTKDGGGDLTDELYRTQVVLTDGGVYDNLGLETAWKRYETVFVSDAGGGFVAETDPKRDWVRHSIRVLLLIDNQVRSLRRRQLVESFKANLRRGAYWSIGHDLARNFSTGGALDCPFEMTDRLAKTPTRLRKLDAATQERLINWGYAVSDAALRKYYNHDFAPPVRFPFPATGVGAK
jgi:NTE family protein